MIKTTPKYFLVIILVLAPMLSYAGRWPRIITISKKVGDTISVQERIKYNLFEEYADHYKESVFLENADKSKILLIHFEDGTKKEIALTQAEYFEYKTQIEKRIIDYSKIDSSMICVIQLIDESSVSGKITKILEKEIILKTKYLGKITIPKKRILDIIFLDSEGKQYGRYWLPNPHDSRYFYAPSARNLPKGEGYFQDMYLVVLSANYGVTNHITLGGGLSIVPTFGLGEQGYFLNPKIGFNLNKKWSVGGGFLYVNHPWYEETDEIEEVNQYDTIYKEKVIRKNAGILFAVSTYGNRENNITLGIGYSYFDENFADKPVFMLGAMCRVSRRISLVTENWFVTTFHEKEFDDEHPTGYYTTAVITYGTRFFGERMSVDIAFAQVAGKMGLGELIFPGIPYLDFVLKF